MVSDRMVSSVMTPPALRMTWASPTSSPSMPNSGIRESMQATTATARAGRTGLLPGNRRAHSSFACEHPVDLGHAHLRRPRRRDPNRGPTRHRSARMGRVRTVEEHQAVVAALLAPLPEEDVALADAHGRVLARDVAAAVALPGFDNSAMDGYAARWAEVSTAAQAPVTLPVADDIPAGRTDVVPLAPGTVQRIMTGAPLPGRRGRRHPGGAHRRRHRGRRDPRRPPGGQPPARGRRGHRRGRGRADRRVAAGRRAARPGRRRGRHDAPRAPPAPRARALHRQRAGRARAAAAARADLRVQLRSCWSPRSRRPAAWPAGCTSSRTTSTSSSPPCAASWPERTC